MWLCPLELGIKASLVIADTSSRHTREAIQKVEAKGQEVLSHFHEIGQLDPAGREAALKKKISLALGRLLQLVLTT